MNAHAPFPPSSNPRWMICTGSFGLGLQAPPEKESEYAAGGTRLHDVAADYLRTKAAPSKEDYAALKSYLNYAMSRIAKASVAVIEQRLEHSQLLFGTPDLLMLFNDRNGPHGLLEIVDLKSGAGILVDPEENGQLLTYAYMALTRLARLHEPLPPKVRLTIVQPPDEDNQIKSWDTTSDYVLAFGVRIEEAIQIAIEGRGELVPGEHCRFCRAKPICPKLRGEMIEALGGPLPNSMTVGSLAQWLDRADRMEQFIKAVREMGHDVAAEAAQQRKPGIPGWGLKPKRATRSWADEEAVLAFARKRKIKIWQDKLMSPAMAEKEHPKGLPEELTKQIVAVSSGMNLVRLGAGEAPAPKVLEPDASKLDKLMANLELMQYRR